MDGALVIVEMSKLTLSPVSIELENVENRALTVSWSVVVQTTLLRLEPLAQLSDAETPISEGKVISK